MARTIRQWFGGRKSTARPAQQEAARTKLQDHIDPKLLESFLQRAVDDDQHETVIQHLNYCDECREAIAVVLLAVDDPKAAAELEFERKRRLLEEPESWWRQAFRWSAFVLLALVLIMAALLVPTSRDPNSRLGRWFEQADNSVSGLFEGEADSSSSSSSSSSTSFGEVFHSTYDAAKPEPRRSRERTVTQPGWDTGPAPYFSRVEPSAPYREVDISGEKPDYHPEQAPAADSKQASGRSGALGPSGATTPSSHLSRRRLVVTPEGELRRTFDGGETWQTIVVAPNVTFRSLALSGRTIWATGNSGALYRSQDAAEHWQQVQIHYRNEPIKDDLVGIEFVDPQHGFMRGASGREWVTVDGGSKWVLNPITAQKE